MEREKRVCAVGIAYLPLVEDLLDLKKFVAKSPSYLRKVSPIFRDKYVFSYLGLIFSYQILLPREV